MKQACSASSIASKVNVSVTQPNLSHNFWHESRTILRLIPLIRAFLDRLVSCSSKLVRKYGSSQDLIWVDLGELTRSVNFSRKKLVKQGEFGDICLPAYPATKNRIFAYSTQHRGAEKGHWGDGKGEGNRGQADREDAEKGKIPIEKGLKFQKLSFSSF